MALLREIVPDIRTWSEFSEEKQLNFNGYYVVHQGESVLVDPPGLEEAGWKELESLVSKNTVNPLRAILLTNVHHERMSRAFKEKFSVPIYINENDKNLLDFSPDQSFKGGDNCFCGLKVIGFNDQKSAGESAFLMVDRKILIVGDALIGKISGKVNLLPPDKYKDIQKARKGLGVLKDIDFDILLVGDGESILADAKKTVAEFLEG